MKWSSRKIELFRSRCRKEKASEKEWEEMGMNGKECEEMAFLFMQ